MSADIEASTHLQEAWDRIAFVIFKPDTPEIQKTEMRRAFYAGAKTALTLIVEIADDIEDEEDAAIEVAKLDMECMAFAMKIQNGEA